MARSRRHTFHLKLAFFPGLLAVAVLGSEDEGKKPENEGLAPPRVAAEGESNLEAGLAKYQQVCAQCHGPKGEGNEQLKAPSIAGLPHWYIDIQVAKFQRSWRGAKPEDVPGNLMHAIAQALDPEGVRDVAGYVTSMELIPTQVTLKGGDPERGAEIFRERCMECHRYNGRGEPAFFSGQLIGLQDWYLVSQMKKFRDGKRGGHDADIYGNKMHRITEKMTDQSFLDISSHLAELAVKYAKEKPRQR